MLLSIGPRQLVIALVAAPERRRDHPAGAGASDRELARLARGDAAATAHAQATTQTLRFRLGLR